LIPKICSVIERYKFHAYGDYSLWSGLNSNTFIQALSPIFPLYPPSFFLLRSSSWWSHLG
jgi:hypothetical protein